MRKISHNQRLKLFKINKAMDSLHNSNNSIYESWVDEDWKEMQSKIKNQINILKQILNGIKEDN